MNNQSEFCAWAKGGWVRQVTFLDLGFTAGKDDCDKDYEYYYRTQHPENDESQYIEGLAGEGMVNPFAGRPTDAMYGDYFELTSDMEQRVADLDGQVSWQPLEAGAVASGRGKIRFHLYLQSNDILPLKLLTTALAVNVEDPESGTTQRAAVLLPVDEEDFPLVLAEGESYEFVFEETIAMRDINEKTIRLHFVVDHEDPWGRTARKVERSYYYKSGW